MGYYGVVYKITNSINTKVYIGQTTNYSNRKSVHKLSYKKEYRSTNNLYSDMREYGFDNFKFEVVCECKSKEELDKMEIYYCKEFDTIEPKGYNKRVGLISSNYNTKMPFRVIDIIDKTEYTYNDGIIPLSRELGVSEGAISSILNKKSHMLCNKRWHFSSDLNLKYTDELRNELLKNKNMKKFIGINLTTNEKLEGYNQREFCEKYGFKPKQLNKVLKGDRYTHNGWTFKYL